MFGPKRNPRPATRLEVGCIGTLFFGMGCFFLWAIAAGERDPSAPAWALAVGVLIPTIVAIVGGWLLFKTVFWEGDARK
ncbi:MAG TPA: hypothetical protein VHC73_12670 [Vitreimonas sp.]|jgi:ABC-type branched-subunit amino acid transport system permease subunit|nr:hypothetical protein [Vitreimonas sp.]